MLDDAKLDIEDDEKKKKEEKNYNFGGGCRYLSSCRKSMTL